MDVYRQLLVLLMLTSSVSMVMSTLSKSDRGKKKKKEEKVAEPVEELEKILQITPNVFERNLVTKDSKAKDIIAEHSKYCEAEKEMKRFSGESLVYVTPWNSHGYDIAKIFRHKFTYVSPVWLQVIRKAGGAFVITGDHDIDKGWISDVTKDKAAKMVPRLLFDGWTQSDYNALFASEDAIEDCIEVLLKFTKAKKFHGLVVELWSQLGGSMKEELIHFLTHFGQSFKKAGKIFILVIPPTGRGSFGQEEFEALAPAVDRFSLMTYDFSNPSRPGPNSPINWVQHCINVLCPDATSPNRKKILTGLNFYGNDYVTGTGEAILGSRYIDILKKFKPKLQWSQEVGEHSLEYRSEGSHHLVYYPSLQAVQDRLQLALAYGTGISIWEIGQGLDFFYDLL